MLETAPASGLSLRGLMSDADVHASSDLAQAPSMVRVGGAIAGSRDFEERLTATSPRPAYADATVGPDCWLATPDKRKDKCVVPSFRTAHPDS